MSEGAQSQASDAGAKFVGSWILEKNENFDAFLAANGKLIDLHDMCHISAVCVCDTWHLCPRL